MDAIFFKNLEYDKNLLLKKLNEGFKLIGGFEKFFKKGEKILLKPNLLAPDPPEKATTTHPVFFEAVAEYFKKKGCIVYAGDSPSISKSIQSAKVAGILDVCNRLGIEFLRFEEGIKVKNPEGRFVKSFLIAKDLNKIDKIVNLPKLKNHALTVFTGSLKNIFGLIPGKEKALWHARKPDASMFSNMIIDLNKLIKPYFSIMDGILAQEGNGPRGGHPIHLGYMIMSENSFLVDLIAVTTVGYNSYNVHIIREYAAREHMPLDITKYNIYGDEIEVNNKFQKITVYKQNMFNLTFLTNIINKIFSPVPVVIKDKCKKCGICFESCPSQPKTISWKKGEYPEFNYKNCIRCFCCQENCPYEAIVIKRQIF